MFQLLASSLHEFDIQRDGHLFAHELAAGFDGCVPQALIAQFGLRRPM